MSDEKPTVEVPAFSKTKEYYRQSMCAYYIQKTCIEFTDIATWLGLEATINELNIELTNGVTYVLMEMLDAMNCDDEDIAAVDLSSIHNRKADGVFEFIPNNMFTFLLMNGILVPSASVKDCKEYEHYTGKYLMPEYKWPEVVYSDKFKGLVFECVVDMPKEEKEEEVKVEIEKKADTSYWLMFFLFLAAVVFPLIAATYWLFN